MTRATRSLLWCLAWLALAEWGLAWVEGELAPRGGLPADRPLWITLGTSRTQRGVDPEVVAEVLQARGEPDPWVVNLSTRGRTSVGLLMDYMKVLHPRMTPGLDARVLAIEVRPSGLNDAYRHDEEQRWFDRISARDLDPDVLLGPAAGGGVDLDRLAGRWWSHVRLSRARELRLAWDTPHVGELPEALTEGAGWTPRRDVRPHDLDERAIREEYRDRQLRDLGLGGIQTGCLRRLVRQALADGWRHVVLYVMPVTDVHRAIFEPGDWARVLELARRVAREEGVPLLDLDTGHGLDEELFTDTHHLGIEGAAVASRLLAERLADVAR